MLVRLQARERALERFAARQDPVEMAAFGETRIEYVLAFIGCSGEPFPAGVEIYALVPALEPLDEELVDRDLWEILRWMVGGAGATGQWPIWKRPARYFGSQQSLEAALASLCQRGMKLMKSAGVER
jgi:hypothetical protein